KPHANRSAPFEGGISLNHPTARATILLKVFRSVPPVLSKPTEGKSPTADWTLESNWQSIRSLLPGGSGLQGPQVRSPHAERTCEVQACGYGWWMTVQAKTRTGWKVY